MRHTCFNLPVSIRKQVVAYDSPIHTGINRDTPPAVKEYGIQLVEALCSLPVIVSSRANRLFRFCSVILFLYR